MTAHHQQCDTAAKNIIDQVGKKIVIGVPLGLGKPIGLLNSLYQLACADKTLDLTIITGLTLARPYLKNELEKRLVEPILERISGNYENPLYERARELQQLPSNINVIEFFLSPGKYLHNNYVQQNYISSCYTTVVRDSLHFGVNVVAQQVAKSSSDSKSYSLSCNSDLFNTIRKKLGKKNIAIVAEVNTNLPFMFGADAIVKEDVFTDVIDTKQYRSLFALPREKISAQEHLIGIYTSCLIRDNGCLQIGIGKLSNAVANALIMRHKSNSAYRSLLKQLSVEEKFSHLIAKIGGLSHFEKGLYASTEMFSDEYMQLYKENILKKRVYDHEGLQSLLNSRKISEVITPKTLDVLLEHKLIREKISLSKFNFLKKFGIIKPDILFDHGNLVLSSGEKIPADLSNQAAKKKIIEACLGTHLQTGKILHAGFFIGSCEFYQRLRDLTIDELQQIEMSTIARTNALSWSQRLLALQRRNARFVNSTMMLTLGGAIVSDGLKDLQEISGVGGQFDFVMMAQQLKSARSIIACPSTRMARKGVESNIVWDYPNQTISRYLRDIVVTEYGIADCRSKTDTEILKAILNVTDSRFQQSLLKKAKQFGKVPSDYQIPKSYQNNFPHNIELMIRNFQKQGYFNPYPFGDDLTAEEHVIERALLYLKKCNKVKLFLVLFAAWFYFASDGKYLPYLKRMKLDKPKNVKEFVYKKLLKFVLVIPA